MAKKKASTEKLSETDFTPETPVSTDGSKESHDRKVKMYAAGVDREKNRIRNENGVRIGDTVLADAKAIEVFNAALDELSEYYATLIS